MGKTSSGSRSRDRVETNPTRGLRPRSSWLNGKCRGPPPKDWKELMIRRDTLSYAEALNREMDEQCDEARDRDRK